VDERAEIERERARLGLPTRAVIGCVHANLEALEAVMADIDQQSIFDIVCLGDVVGYGPNPMECLEVVRGRCRFTVRGHMDEAFFEEGTPRIGLHAAQTIEWTRKELVRRDDLRAFLAELPLRHDLYVHGSPRDPCVEYLLRTELELGPTEKYEEVFAAIRDRLFVAHSHLPGVITSDYDWHDADKPFERLPGTKAVVNVGSVGQPRDRDARACYALVAEGRVEWRRVAYDVAKTQETMRQEGFPDSLVKRLAMGV
jgi:diadenosine tetraphosphatase ApaH/serine/threonine PP2A family protein phosphatase